MSVLLLSINAIVIHVSTRPPLVQGVQVAGTATLRTSKTLVEVGSILIGDCLKLAGGAMRRCGKDISTHFLLARLRADGLTTSARSDRGR